MSNGGEPSVTPKGVQVISDFGRAELPHIVKYHRSGNNEVGDDILPDELSNFNRDNGGNSFSFNSLSEVIHRDQEVFALAGGLWAGPSMSMPHVANSRGLMIGVKGVVGRYWMGVNFWHLSLMQMKFMVPPHREGQ